MVRSHKPVLPMYLREPHYRLQPPETALSSASRFSVAHRRNPVEGRPVTNGPSSRTVPMYPIRPSITCCMNSTTPAAYHESIGMLLNAKNALKSSGPLTSHRTSCQNVGQDSSDFRAANNFETQPVVLASMPLRVAGP